MLMFKICFNECLPKIVISLLLILLQSLKAVEIQTRITHGAVAQIVKFPWFVIIKEPGFTNVHCGATLISADWVLTAGHCLYQMPVLCFYFGSMQLRNPEALTMWSQEFFISAGYNDKTYDNDIGLVKLPQALQFNTRIQPLPLISRAMAKQSLVGQYALIVGLGVTTDKLPNSYPPFAYFAAVKIINKDICEKLFPFELPLNSICSVGATQANEKICDGDSGGGLIARGDQGENVLIGVNSFGSPQCTHKPSGYSYVGAFLDWIENTTSLILK